MSQAEFPITPLSELSGKIVLSRGSSNNRSGKRSRSRSSSDSEAPKPRKEKKKAKVKDDDDEGTL